MNRSARPMPESVSAVNRVWESSAFWARAARAALIPFSWIYAAVIGIRNAAYDRGWLRSHRLALPAIAVGNLTVGGTGKTPVAAFIARRLGELGIKPAIVLRGYGADESLVHARLNPAALVIISPDRVRGAVKAAAAGCDAIVLDDAFQHRRARRDLDIVLLAADLAGPARALPAGPWREPLTSLARASFVIVTRKRASFARASDVLTAARRFAPAAGAAIVHLAADSLVNWHSGEIAPLESLRNKTVLAAAAIGDPRSFGAQLAVAGGHVELAASRDHHAYSATEAGELARRGAGFGFVVCTLKDAVKLGPLWPREGPPLWYLSQRVEVESGAAELDRILTAIAGQKPTD
jgi:tetraacyldisaccharide 4'-kinase